MLNRNQSALLLITLLTLILSGYLFYSGINSQILKSRQVTSSPVPTASTEIVLGEKTEVENFGAPAKVTKVVDGDTIKVKINGVIKDIRFIGINTPETVDPRRPVECFGKEASNEAKRIMEGQVVYLEKDVSETDKFNRLLKYVYLKLDDGSFLFVNDYLVRQGYAYASSYAPDVREDARFREAEREARENNRGLWGSCQ